MTAAELRKLREARGSYEGRSPLDKAFDKVKTKMGGVGDIMKSVMGDGGGAEDAESGAISGVTSGAMTGNPYAAVIGGVAGAVQGAAKARAAAKAHNAQVEAKKQTALGEIEQDREKNKATAMANLSAAFSRSFR